MPDHTGARAPAVLAIDGGNSKTEVALVSAAGELLAEVRGGGTNPQTAGWQQAWQLLGDLVRDAVRLVPRAAGGDRAPGLIARHTSACMAGADLPEEEAQLTTTLAAQGWSETCSVINDTFAVLRAGLDDADRGAGRGPTARWGVAVTCGAGINCVGVAPDGRISRFLGLGELSGDWGGGGDLGTAALWWAIRAEDGRGPQTRLRQAVAAHFGVGEIRDVVIGIYTGRIPSEELRNLAPAVLSAAAGGDEVAARLVSRQADEVCVMALTTIRRLGLAGRPGVAVPVVLGGSLLAARDPVLNRPITARLAAECPAAQLRITDIPPVAGAALIGLDRLGAPAEAAARLRAAFAARPANPGRTAGPARAAAGQQRGRPDVAAAARQESGG